MLRNKPRTQTIGGGNGLPVQAVANAFPQPDLDDEDVDPNDIVVARPAAATAQAAPAPFNPYDEDEEDFNARAVPRRSADRSRLYPQSAGGATHSACSSAPNTPVPARSSSPFPFYYSGASSCSSDSESEPDSPLLSGSRRPTSSWRNGERPRWWQFRLGSRGSSAGSTDAWRRRRRFRDVSWGLRSCKRLLRRLVRHPFFPKTPVTIVSPVRSFIHVGFRACREPTLSERAEVELIGGVRCRGSGSGLVVRDLRRALYSIHTANPRRGRMSGVAIRDPWHSQTFRVRVLNAGN